MSLEDLKVDSNLDPPILWPIIVYHLPPWCSSWAPLYLIPTPTCTISLSHISTHTLNWTSSLFFSHTHTHKRLIHTKQLSSLVAFLEIWRVIGRGPIMDYMLLVTSLAFSLLSSSLSPPPPNIVFTVFIASLVLTTSMASLDCQKPCVLSHKPDILLPLYLLWVSLNSNTSWMHQSSMLIGIIIIWNGAPRNTDQILHTSPLLTHAPLSHWILLTEHRFQDKILRVSRWQQRALNQGYETLLSVMPLCCSSSMPMKPTLEVSLRSKSSLQISAALTDIWLNCMRFQIRNTQAFP